MAKNKKTGAGKKESQGQGNSSKASKKAADTNTNGVSQGSKKKTISKSSNSNTPQSSNRSQQQTKSQRQQTKPKTKTSSSSPVGILLGICLVSLAVAGVGIYLSEDAQIMAGNVYKDHVEPLAVKIRQLIKDYSETQPTQEPKDSHSDIPDVEEQKLREEMERQEQKRKENERKEEIERQQKEREELERKEQDRKAKEERERREREERMKAKEEKKRKETEEAERKVEQERKEKEKKEEEERKRKEKEEAQRKAEQERLENEKKEAEDKKRKEKEEADKKAEQERRENEKKKEEERKRKEKEEAQRKAEQEMREKGKKEAEEKKRKEKEEADKKAEQERRENEKKKEEERKRKEKEEAQRKAEQEMREKEKKEAEEKKREEKEEVVKKAEQERRENEKKKEEERKRKEKAEMDKKAEQERKENEKKKEEERKRKEKEEQEYEEKKRKDVEEKKRKEKEADRKAELERQENERKDEEERRRKYWEENEKQFEQDRKEKERKEAEERKRKENDEADTKAKEKKEAEEPYEFASITNANDFKVKDDLDEADRLYDEDDYEGAILMYDSILKRAHLSPRAMYGKGLTLDKLGFKHMSNEYLEQAINFLGRFLLLPDVPGELFLMGGRKLAERQHFRGWGSKAVKTFTLMLERFPEDVKLRCEMGVSHMLVGRNDQAQDVFEQVLQLDANSGFAKVHLGFIFKIRDNNLEKAIPLLRDGIASGEEGTIDGRFYVQLGDALLRLGQEKEARHYFKEAEDRGLFLSQWQRSLYNVKDLTARPFWTQKQLGYEKYIQLLEKNWETIRDEGLAQMNEKEGSFKPEEENLRDTGEWKQFTLYQQGRKNTENCAKVPKTCALIDQMPPAKNCKRGQVKFSVMGPGIHVWPHTGPTNCRLRSHLGLVVPEGPVLRVVNETRTWTEGKVMTFDDSFEHEVWHKGTQWRLILIVDFWHPEVTERDRRTLSPI